MREEMNIVDYKSGQLINSPISEPLLDVEGLAKAPSVKKSWISSEVRNCTFTDCSLWPHQTGDGKQDPKERSEAIRLKCVWCMCDQKKEVRLCPSVDCPLWCCRRGYVERSIEIKPTPLKIPHIESKNEHQIEIEYSG